MTNFHICDKIIMCYIKDDIEPNCEKIGHNNAEYNDIQFYLVLVSCTKPILIISDKISRLV